jgi:diguanylate cyclase (GGDEF)-like protein/PAS domain S-box-containing protein
VARTLPDAERRRLTALADYGLVDPSNHAGFASVASVVAHFLDVPMAAVFLIDADVIKLAPAIGLSETELPRSWALVSRLLNDAAVLMVPDAEREPAFDHDPLPVGAWAAAPMRTPSGAAIGGIFVADHRARSFTPTQMSILDCMAQLAMAELEVRRHHVMVHPSRRHFESLLRDASDTVAVLDADGVLAYASPGLIRLLGYPENTLISGSQMVHAEDMPPLVAAITVALARPGITGPVEFRMANGDGSWRDMEAVVSNCFDDPAVRGIVVYLRDISDRKRQTAALAAESRVLEAIAAGATLDHVLHAVVGLVESQIPGGRAVLRTLDESTCMLRVLSAPSLPSSFIALVRDWPLGARPPWLVEATAQGEIGVVEDLTTAQDIDPAFRASALAHQLHATWLAPVLSPDDGRLLGTVTVYLPQCGAPSESDEQVLRTAAMLMGLALKRHGFGGRVGHSEIVARPELVRRLDLTLHDAAVRGDKVAVMLLDLDRFKEVNEGFGHDAGDQVLPQVAQRLARVVRPEDMVARVAGDEFVVVCERLVGELEAVGVAERIHLALREPMRLARADIRVSASIGIAMTHGEGDHAESLLRDADAALYQAKQRGPARFELFNEARRRDARDRRQLDGELERALERNELRVWLQPEIELATGRQLGFEALVRWQHPERGLLAPGEFIPQAERSGLINDVGTWVLQEACRYGRRWRDDHPGEPCVVAVNLSARQLTEPRLAALVTDALNMNGLEPDHLCLELTESALMEDADMSLGVLRSLKALGVCLAIDDFGTGYSSLAYLRRFPIDAVKIDRSFVSGLGTRSEDGAIVTAVLGLTTALGLSAIAEGVEQECQRDALVGMGCEAAQGFFFSPPRPAHEFV